MRNKALYLLAAVAAILLGIFYNERIHRVYPQVAGVSFDRSVKAEQGVPITVMQAIDGDTVTLINGERLRYVGIDTPEEFDPRKPVQCFAHEAAQKNKSLVEGKSIKFYKDIDAKDLYGRWLGFVYLEDETFVNLELVKQGYAFAYPYPPDISKASKFADAEAYARENRLGLWGGQCTVTKLKSGREQTNPVE
ncbi:MAG: thermonuclease family protein [Candidatus Doudnabacteria bacterium]|nr:thermonuclease family protein [Candidatus Doudnabacteria bacterium]